MGNTQYFRLINNVDLHARLAKYHVSCNCDFVVRYNNIQCANANIAGNGDHMNSAVPLTKAYKWDNLELTVVNQNQGWPSQMFVIYILRDLNVMGLKILIAWVINCSHVYEMTGSHCDISLSNVSTGNKVYISIWHVDPERFQLGMLHDWQLASILWRSPNPWSLVWLCLQQNSHP